MKVSRPRLRVISAGNNGVFSVGIYNRIPSAVTLAELSAWKRLVQGRSTVGVAEAGVCSGVLYLVYDSLESLRVVDSEVGEHFAVDFDTCFVNEAHELGI